MLGKFDVLFFLRWHVFDVGLYMETFDIQSFDVEPFNVQSLDTEHFDFRRSAFSC
jgi:hypothetical protein